VEELVVGFGGARFTHRLQWRRFFGHLQQVRFVQVPSEVALDVAHSFQLDGQEPAVDLLPALEQVEVHMTHHQYVPLRDPFEPLIAARKQVGRPIRLSWT